MTTTPDLDAPLARARTLLFVPGNRPERFMKALASGADAVVLDLEDAVPADAKVAAREAIAAAWQEVRRAGLPLVVRISAPASEAGIADLAWLARLQPAPDAVMVPKADGVDALQAVVQAAPGVPLLPLIESAAGWDALPVIASTPGVLRLVIGHIDFVADTGLLCSDDERELVPLRFAVAMHTRLQQLAPAIDGVTAAFDDDARLRADTQRALRFGFGAKLCIHPRQVAVVHDALAPSADERAWAERVLAADAASGGAAVQLDGRMVDLPVVLQARRTLARSRPPEDRR
ncbi:HpcH/HpaI aldolase/citrate lyase family protein [Aquabacterium humicola]|uniref:HpcH/HpaI aldolase/citrate lyase family protein n=1 Tax=Aquabacterium humicola TaxID=3237377 RepID=UPI002542942A|nr:CoA ester lyase [Rubrivivax pictus]